MKRVDGKRSSRTRRVVVALTIAAFLVGIALVFGPGVGRFVEPGTVAGSTARTDDPSRGPPTFSESTIASGAETSPIRERIDSQPVRESVESTTGPLRVRVVAGETNAPLTDFRVWEKAGPSTRDAPILVTDPFGETTLAREVVESMRPRAGEEFESDGRWKTVVPIRRAKLAHVAWPDRDGVVVIEFRTLATVRVIPTRAGVRADVESVSIVAVPPVPDGIAAADRARLESLRMIDVDAFHRLAGELGCSVDPIVFERSGSEISEGPIEMFLPWTGDACVTLVEKSLTKTTVFTTTAIGTIRELDIELSDQPRITGRVVHANGAPAPGVLVTVGMRTEFDSRTMRDGVPPEVPLVGVTIVQGANPAAPHLWTVISQAHAVSRADGAYDVAVDYTDDVAAWVFDPRVGRGFAVRDVGGRLDAAQGLDVILTEPHTRRVRLLDENDVPLAGIDVDVYLVGGLGGATRDFEVRLPTVSTDERGELDASLLVESERYSFLLRAANFGSVPYRIADGPVLRCRRVTPRK